MISQEDISLIHKYLEDDLTQEDIPLFKKRFESNPEFAAEVKKYTDMSLALRSVHKMKLASDKDGRVIELPDPMSWTSDLMPLSIKDKPENTVSQSRLWFKLAIAASLLLLISIGSIFVWQITRQPLHHQLFAAYYTNPLENEQEFLSRSETFGEDAAALEKFMRAIQYMEQNKFKTAVEMLESITHTRESRLMDEVEWYLALCYLRTGKKEKAINLFVDILNSQSIHNAAARNIYHELTER
jgi:predicted negative regulator of RcsB-dependent stress response